MSDCLSVQMSCQAGIPVLGLESGAEQLPWEAENRDFCLPNTWQRLQEQHRGVWCGRACPAQPPPQGSQPTPTHLGHLPPPLLLPKIWGRSNRGLVDIICCPSKKLRLMGKATPFPTYQTLTQLLASKCPPGLPRAPRLAAEPTHRPLCSHGVLQAPVNQTMPHKLQLVGRSFPSAIIKPQCPQSGKQ